MTPNQAKFDHNKVQQEIKRAKLALVNESTRCVKINLLNNNSYVENKIEKYQKAKDILEQSQDFSKSEKNFVTEETEQISQMTNSP